MKGGERSGMGEEGFWGWWREVNGMWWVKKVSGVMKGGERSMMGEEGFWGWWREVNEQSGIGGKVCEVGHEGRWNEGYTGSGVQQECDGSDI